MTIEIKDNLTGSILDIGGGGEAVIGQVYGNSVTAIDNMQKELDEAPNCCKKLLMDATKLSFQDQSFDNVTFFYSLMYMSEEVQQKAICEAVRVLKKGGIVCIWDSDIQSAYPVPFLVDLDIEFRHNVIHVSYGIVKNDAQDYDLILHFLKRVGLRIESSQNAEGQFYFQCRKD